ncbi:MAG: hypothetical protein ACM3KR_10290 [Deltaproteobacteria bacterium]
MEKFKWPTDSCWIDETFDIFKNIDNDFEIESLSKKIRTGETWGDRKATTAIRVFEAIKARYLKHDRNKVIALSSVINSSISKQEKYNHLLIYYLEYENLVEFFLSNYIFENLNKYSQKTYTSMDLDRFFEIVLNDYNDYLPDKLQKEISDKSMNKARNQLWKNIETFGWGEKTENKLIIKRPNLTPEWITYTLYFYFPEESISMKDIYKSDIYKRFLLNEVDLDFLINGAKMKGLLDVQSLGDISTINRKERGLSDYARSYK